MSIGSPKEVKKQLKRLFTKMQGGHLLVICGCGFSANVSLENARAIVKRKREYPL